MNVSRQKLNSFFLYLADIFMPNRCPCCDAFIEWDKLICEKCKKELEYYKSSACNKCGKTKCICNNRKLFYDYCFSCVIYKDIVKDGIISLKVKNGINFAKYHAKIIADKITEYNLEDKIDYVTYVPMTRKKQRNRGYNQAEEFAYYISKYINKPLLNNILVKAKDTQQHSLNYKQRLTAVKGSYIESKNIDKIKGKRIILCDDVITTGSTLNECSKKLKQYGVKNIICAVIATTDKNN